MSDTTTAVLSHPAQEILVRIQAWPWWDEIGKVAHKEYHLSEGTYHQYLPEYQKFLGLLLSGYHGLGMFHAIVDQIWHSHILHTQRYADFCLQFNAGQFIHHIPQLEAKEQSQCSVCQSCRGCNTKCKNCQGRCKSDGNVSPSSAEYFHEVYTHAYGVSPQALWQLPVADGIATISA